LTTTLTLCLGSAGPFTPRPAAATSIHNLAPSSAGAVGLVALGLPPAGSTTADAGGPNQKPTPPPAGLTEPPIAMPVAPVTESQRAAPTPTATPKGPREDSAISVAEPAAPPATATPSPSPTPVPTATPT